jgi:hypothetical protein
VERSCGLTNRNRKEAHDRTSGLPTTKSITIKGHGGISGGRAAKAVELTPRDLRGSSQTGLNEPQGWLSVAQKSAAGIIGGTAR